MMKLFLVLAAIFSFNIILTAQNFSGGFNFNLPWDDSTSQKFLPVFPAHVITEFVSVNSNGNFAIGGTPIRFWGTNLVADGAFPDPDKADAIAGRLRKMGFNLVRFHHMDNAWSERSLFADAVNTRSLNPFYLDNFECLIAALKKNSIYANINLHVARAFKEMDGVANADSIPDYGKGVTIFDPYLIQLQKEYAQQLLTHINPYTNLPLVDDPVMAMLEITNENSLYRMWRDNVLKTFGDGGKLIWRHNRMLDSLWNKFLSGKYTSTQNLANSWNADATNGNFSNLIKNGDFESVAALNNWQVELDSPNASAQQTKDVINPYQGFLSAKVTVTKVSGTSWHIQWKQVNLKILKDSIYSVEFAARADGNKKIFVSVGEETSPWTGYAWKEFNINSNWKVYSFTFKASDNCSNTRLAFQFNNSIGNYWFDEIKLGLTGKTGLMPGELVENSSVLRIDYSEAVKFTDARVKNMSAFYINLQDDYFADMKNYLVNILKVKVPIVGSNWNVGPGDLTTQSKLDYIDNHTYWDHPSFPNIPWSATDWQISNQPMVTSKSGFSIADVFAGVPSVGKPFTISEVNYCFPNRYQTEGLIFVTAYSAFNNTDAIMFFDYNGSNDWSTDKITSYFDLQRNTAMMSLMPSCAYAFRNGFISKSIETVKLNYTNNQISLLSKNESGDWSGPSLFAKRNALINELRNESFDSSIPTDFTSIQDDPVNPYKSNTKEIIWNTDGLISINTKKFIGAAGFLNDFINTKIGNLQIKNADGFGTFTWTTLTNDSLSISSKSLMSISTVTQNTGMVWDGINTFHNNWGRNPTQMKPISVSFQLKIFADSIIISPLDSYGRVNVNQVKTLQPTISNYFDVTFDQNQNKTLWYGIEKFGKGVNTFTEKGEESELSFHIDQNFPNPFNSTTTIKYFLPEESQVKIIIYDILGKKVASLFDSKQNAGVYSIVWNAKNDSGNDVVSGTYIIRFHAGDYSSSKKILLLK
ncbi:MAG: carbohydrate binding domain-containing protein [Ignavibacteriales bacterium]|nr:carbohydrate binding domain-containing protein [Ignavibacteriales bacterium]